MVPSCRKDYWSKFQCITGVPHRGFTSQVGLIETKVEPADHHLLFHLRKPKRVPEQDTKTRWMTGTCNWLSDFHSDVYNVHSLNYMKPSLTFPGFRKS
jgi:hypothetical protein